MCYVTKSNFSRTRGSHHVSEFPARQFLSDRYHHSKTHVQTVNDLFVVLSMDQSTLLYGFLGFSFGVLVLVGFLFLSLFQ